MNRPRRLLIPLIALVVSLSAPPKASPADAAVDDWGDDQLAEKMALDTLVVRPVGLAATVLGSVIYVISLPFSYTGGNQYEAQQALVEDPARHTFQRPLGRDF
jgi:hypothetical protein